MISAKSIIKISSVMLLVPFLGVFATDVSADTYAEYLTNQNICKQIVDIKIRKACYKEAKTKLGDMKGMKFASVISSDIDEFEYVVGDIIQTEVSILTGGILETASEPLFGFVAQNIELYPGISNFSWMQTDTFLPDNGTWQVEFDTSSLEPNSYLFALSLNSSPIDFEDFDVTGTGELGIGFFEASISPVPLSASIIFFAIGLGGLTTLKKRKTKI